MYRSDIPREGADVLVPSDLVSNRVIKIKKLAENMRNLINFDIVWRVSLKNIDRSLDISSMNHFLNLFVAFSFAFMSSIVSLKSLKSLAHTYNLPILFN